LFFFLIVFVNRCITYS